MLRRLRSLRLATAAPVRQFTVIAGSDLQDAGAFECDTIYALSSAPGKAGVAVIRISGDLADSCLQQLTKSTALPAPRAAALRKIYHPKTEEHLDDALVLRFPHPKSFTGEDIVELHTHGSLAVVSGVLEALSHLPRCRAAEAGEFTERAFDNNKIDLVQVEGLADLLNSETEAQRNQALRQLSGDIGEIYEGWRDSLVRCLAYTEAMIDFGDDEDDVTDAAYEAAVNRDTAGLRETEDIVEREGVLRAQQCASDADICVVMMDIQNAALLHSDEYQAYLKDGSLAVLNKSDQIAEGKVTDILNTFDEKQCSQLLVISCAEGNGIDVFVDNLAAAVKEKLEVSSGGSASGALITRERHRQNLVECLACLDRFLDDPYQSEIAAEDLRRAVVAIGRILGRIDVEDVLDVLFADFSESCGLQGMIEFTSWEVYTYEDDNNFNNLSLEDRPASDQSGASGALFVGDSAGCISVYAHAANSAGPDTTLGVVDDKQLSEQVDTKFQFRLKRKFSHFHSLGISKLQMIADNCFVVSLGFDEKAQIIDAISGALSSTICSDSAARFVSCSWDERGNMLMLGDAAGYVHLWNIFEDKLVSKTQMVTAMPLAIIGLHILTSGDFLLTGLANGVKQWICNRNTGYIWSFAKKATVCTFKAHTDAVCCLTQHGCLLFSGSEDTLLRMWNMFKLEETYELGVLRPPSLSSSSGSGSPIVCLDVTPAEKLHNTIKDKKLEDQIQVIITSPLTRAIETTIGAFPDTKIPIIVEPSCREMMDTACDIGRVPAELAEQFLPLVDIDFSMLDPFWWLEIEKFPRTGPGNAPPANIVAPKTAEEVLPLRESEKELDARICEFITKLAERPEEHIAVVGHSSFFKRMLRMSRKLNNCELYEISLGEIQLRYTQ
ncbi:hypothetical protein BBO99_00001522 [Phytophthora kernoviae]|uniref:Uncharacterized protein n=2 Tax=Phytophthora kernoviae TaxID=325452 RepID=A0A3R7G0Q4_9STRA|nr:hypothetical protein G195_010422 [Phytophthora kernoviae 00238/432]KAG2530128.1 hypothetical protein JM18_002394 [Phytophthora kernoviae]RLN20320.1 hypothetical protein BBI17_001345 [Phytophthora kernoviae]RLN84159.1 hypothetical protein BBO99_00001522 [Phytophthora kernoviae]